ncbi:hypothetical protein FOZ62_029923 [Perkinsus olseni]|uniref:Uncharacterized protein n=1 Tax=Perkinsus olseni TaxID=32597 RepID=A0A7J6U542_PEROL|nr:hypothetical protein FOZ62_029923 [Perkinsus olseni]
MLPIQLLLFRDTGQDDMALGKVLGALVNLFTTLHERMQELGSGYPTGPPPVSTALLAPVYALLAGHTDSEEVLSVGPSEENLPEVGGEGLRGRTRNKEGSSESLRIPPQEHRAALRSAIGHRSSSPSSPTSVTSVGEGDSGTATIDGTIDDTPTRGVPKRCSHLSFRDDRRCHLPALATSEFCELHHSDPCSSDRRRCPVCEVRLPTDAEAEHHCRGPDYGEGLAGKGYYSRDCNSGPMLCVADSEERRDIGNTEWQARILRQSEGCDETNPYQLEVGGLDTTVPSAVRRHYIRVEAVASRVAAILAAATRNGVTDLVLVEYQCEGAGLSSAIAERITTSLALSSDSKVTFLLVTNRSEGLPSGEACEAIESLRCGFTVAGVVVDLKDLCFNGLLQEFVEVSAWATSENTPDGRAAVGRAASRLIDAARLIAVKESGDFSLWTDVKLHELRCGAEADGDLLLELLRRQNMTLSLLRFMIKSKTVREAILFVKKLQVERIREAHTKLVEEIGPMVNDKVERTKAGVRD